MLLDSGPLRYAVRKLLRSPGFSAVTILTLALGIGANTAIFSVVEGVLLSPLPYAQPDRLVGLWHSAPGIGIPEFEQSVTTYTLYAESGRSFDGIAIVDTRSLNLTDRGDPTRLAAAAITPSLFRVLGVNPRLGRPFNLEDVRGDGARVVLLGDHLWRERFGGDPGVVGRTIRLDGDGWEIVGVMPRGFNYPDAETELWLPFAIDPEDLGQANFSYEAVGRLASGATLEGATHELNELLGQLPQRYPGELSAAMMEEARFSAFVRPLRDDVVGDVRAILWILLGTVGILLLIACANVANLFLVRAEGRQREVALRSALGAGFGDLLRHSLAESMVLAGAAGLAGLGLAFAGIRGLVALCPFDIPRLDEVGLNPAVLAFTAGVSILAGLVFGALPILRYRRLDLLASLKEGAYGGMAGRRTHRLRKTLVAAQVALALILLAGSALMARSFWSLRGMTPGFDARNVLTFRLSLPTAGYETAESRAGLYQRLLDELEALPGVAAAGAITNLPMADGQSNSAVHVADFPVMDGKLPPIIRVNQASPGYFEAMGIPLLEGRPFERRDHEARTGAVVVSAAFARRFWPDTSPIGKRIGPGVDPQSVPWYTIAGVVGNVRDDGLAGGNIAMVYYPLRGLSVTDGSDNELAARTMSVAVRADADPLAFAGSVRRAVWTLDPALPLANVRTAESIVADSTAPTAFTALLLAIAALMALLLGAVGIYGVISYVVSQRTREIAVRMALGAQRGSVSRMVVSGALVVTAVGVAIGLAGALVLTRLMHTLLFGVSATDPATYLGVALLLLAVSAAASYFPARRAATVDPIEALRNE